MIARPCPRCKRYIPVGARCSCTAPAPSRGKRDKAYDQQRDPKLVQFYHSAAWKRLRRKKLADYPFCERCQARGIRPIPLAVEVHHVVPVKTAWERRFELANLEALCHQCHAAETRREHRGGGTEKSGKAITQHRMSQECGAKTPFISDFYQEAGKDDGRSTE